MSEENREPVQRASFIVRQDGMTVASGSGPEDEIRRMASHYAAIYSQDGPVKVRVWRLKPLRNRSMHSWRAANA